MIRLHAAILAICLAAAPAFAAPVNILKVVAPQQQATSMGCWMTAGAMVYSFQHNTNTNAQSLSMIIGFPWLTQFTANIGLAPADVVSFGAALHLTYVPPQNPTMDAWASWLSHGPIWVGVIAPQGPHILVITGLQGDGTPAGTNVIYNDPSDGQPHTKKFSDFLHDLEKVPRAAGANALFPQILHM